MPSNQTPNYALSQWEPGDKVQRTDFNADNAKIDAALEAKCEIVTGTYKGDGAESQFIDLGFTPLAVLVFRNDGATFSNIEHYGGFALLDCPAQYEDYTILSIVEGGFIVRKETLSRRRICANDSDSLHYYIAFR